MYTTAMAKRRLALLGAFTALAAAALLVAPLEAGPETVRRIAPGVWFREGDLENLGHSNHVIIEMQDYLIVVDANFPSGARAALADCKRIAANKPVKYVFLTHHHGDHAFGSAVWTEAGATTMAFQAAADELARTGAERWRQAAEQRKDVAALNRSGPEPPTEIIKENLHVLNDGRRKVQFHHFGWGHTRGDGFVYLPREQVLITGDAVVNGPYNYLGDSNLAHWPEVIRAAGKLKVTHVLPGHGPAGGKELLAGQEQFLLELHKAVQAGIAAGRTPEQIKASLDLPESVRPWVGDSLERQIEEAHRQLSR